MKRNFMMHRRNFLSGVSVVGMVVPATAFSKTFSELSVEDIDSKINYIRIDNEDNRFETMKKGFNLRWPHKEGASCIYICKAEDDVINSLSHAHRNGFRVTVRSGGHCYEGFVSNKIIPNDANSERQQLAIIDLGMMNGMDYADDASLVSKYDEAENKYCFRIASGAQNWDSYVNLYKTAGKTVPGGSCYSVGLGGHITGGGYGLLSRRHGLTVDWLSGVDILIPKIDNKTKKTIGFQVRHVCRDSSKKEDLDLFIACCGGGGGNFGIVLNYYFASLPDAPQTALLISLNYKWSDIKSEENFGKFLRAYWKWFSENDQDWNNPDPKKANGGLFSLLKLNHVNTGDIQLLVQYVGQSGAINDDNVGPFLDFIKTMNDASGGKLINLSPPSEDGSPVQQPFGDAIGTVIMNMARKMDWLYLTQSLNGSGDNLFGKYKSVYQKKDFPDKSIGALFKFLSDSNFGQPKRALVQIDSYGGCINENKNDVTKKSSVYQRESLLKWQFQVYWDNEKDANPCIDWVRSIFSDCFVSGKPYEDKNPAFQGCYINYPDSDMKYINYLSSDIDENWMNLYYGSDIKNSLISIKISIDPENIFRHEMSIPLI